MLELTCLPPKLLSTQKSPGSPSFWFHGQCLCVKTEVNSVCWMRKCLRLWEGSNSQTLNAQWGGRRLLLEQRWTPSLASPKKGVLMSKHSLFHTGNYWNLEIFYFPGERDKPHFTKENEKKMSKPYMTKCTMGTINRTIDCSRSVTIESNRPFFADSISQQLGKLPDGSLPSPGVLKISRWIHLYMHWSIL